MNFVKRIVEPRSWPKMTFSGGHTVTHLMSQAENVGGHAAIAYPSVVYDPETRDLKQLAIEDALGHATTTGEYIAFDTPDDALLFILRYREAAGRS